MVKEITGKHVLFITVSAFAVIIGVNVFMATKAIGTFPGLEVKNSYVASQTFDVERDAQEALGWTVGAEIAGTDLRVEITDDRGYPVEVGSVTGILGRATSVQHDITPDFVFDGAAYVADVGALEAGYWAFRMQAEARDGTAFKQRLELFVKQ